LLGLEPGAFVFVEGESAALNGVEQGWSGEALEKAKDESRVASAQRHDGFGRSGIFWAQRPGGFEQSSHFGLAHRAQVHATLSVITTFAGELDPGNTRGSISSSL
tara:strand:- start:248 stop:562 length:315 start_codon:yes stop_codon:yes gene_type:complete